LGHPFPKKEGLALTLKSRILQHGTQRLPVKIDPDQGHVPGNGPQHFFQTDSFQPDRTREIELQDLDSIQSGDSIGTSVESRPQDHQLLQPLR
jgi:hypothetical protein